MQHQDIALRHFHMVTGKGDISCDACCNNVNFRRDRSVTTLDVVYKSEPFKDKAAWAVDDKRDVITIKSQCSEQFRLFFS